jgi:hypothetical protein
VVGHEEPTRVDGGPHGAQPLPCPRVVSLCRETSKEAELLVLRHENAVLRRQIAAPVRYEPPDRCWFAVLSSHVSRRRWREIFPVAPGTLLAWHRRFIAAKWDYAARRGPIGRPSTHSAVRKIVPRLAKDHAVGVGECGLADPALQDQRPVP